MPVFDFSNTPDSDKAVVCTYTTFLSNERIATPEKPILVLDNRERKWKDDSNGMFTNPIKETTFEFNEEDGKFKADILKVDARFVALLKWLGKNHISVRLTCQCGAKTV